MVPTLVENSKLFCVLVCYLFCKINKLLLSEPMHIALKEMMPCSPATNYHLKSEAFIMFRCQPFTQQYDSRTVRKVPLQLK